MSTLTPRTEPGTEIHSTCLPSHSTRQAEVCNVAYVYLYLFFSANISLILTRNSLSRATNASISAAQQRDDSESDSVKGGMVPRPNIQVFH